MINLKELRIGNNVSYVGCVSWVNGIYLSHFTVYDNNMIQRNSAQDNIQPILLNPEVLEKCGFEKISDGDGGYYRELLSENGFLFVEGDKKGYTDVYIDLWEQLRVRHLHQLQNLYFTLTGKELQYSPK